MNYKQTINSFSAWTVDRLTGARRATLTMLATFLIAMTAQTAWADGVEYINASGTVANTGNETVTAITSSNAAVELVGGWYVVNGNVTINGELTFKNDVDLILADGATLSVKGLYCMDNDNINQNLTIYGQSLGTGKVSSDANHTDNTNYGDFRAATITINGGIVVAESEGARDNDMPGIRASVDLIINGGQVSCANAKVKVGGTITLGWQKATDYIWINTIKKDHYSQDYTQDITLSKSFVKFKSLGYDIYSGTATASDIAFENDPLRRKLYANKWEISDDVDGRSEEKAFGISSVEELKLLSMITNDGYSSGRYFKLKKNITFTYTDAWNAASSTENNFTPIGLTAGSTTDGCFKGHFDGQGYYISGIRINNDEKDNGLFRYLMEASVKNLTLKDSRITGSAYAGGIAGQSSSGTIACTISGCVVENNVYIYAKKVTDPSYAGGIVGDNGSTIIGCSSAASVKADYAGGIAGYNNTTIKNCFAYEPTIAGDNSDNCGAIVGREEGSLSNNYYYTTTTLKGVGYYQTDNTTKIDVDGARKAYTVTLGTYVSMDGTATAHGTVTNDGDISITSYANNSGIMYTTKSGGTTTSTIYAGATETINLTYSGTVAEGCGVGYKVNDGEATAGNTITMPAADATITEVDMDLWGNGDGSETNPYVITTTDGLDLLAQKVNGGIDTYKGKYFKLGADITYDKTVENNYTPIGNNNNYFYGTFDGQGYTISGININNPTADYLGIFGFLYGTVENLVVSDCSIVAYQSVGAIAGYLGTATIENCSASDNVILSGNSYVGGIAGSSSLGTIKGCVSAAAITGTRYVGNDAYDLGGIVGATLSDSKVIDNLFTGTISDNLNQYIGAIVGGKEYGTLTNNVYTSAGFGGIGAEGSATGSDGAGARKAYTVTLSDGVAPSGTQSEYDVSGITVYADNNIILYNSTYYAAADQSVKLSYSGVVAEGCGVGYKVNDGEATAGNTITMPAADATITEVDMALWGNGDGSETNPYVITTTEGLDYLAKKVNVENNTYQNTYFKLGADIEYDGTADNFTPISYIIVDENRHAIERPFRGHFDGNGKTISGINLNNSVVDDHGIFGYLYGTVKNLVVNNCSIVADHNIGAIVGVLYGTIENCHVGSDVTLSGHSHVGGIAGWCADATIKGCTSAATIKGIQNSGSNAGHLGGIVGATNGPSSSLTDNLFTGAITGDLGQYIGAIFGWGNEYATLTNNVYTSAGFGGIGAEGSATGSDGAGARKAVVIGAAEGVTITPTGKATTYNVSGITTYADNNVLGYDSKLYAGATDAVKLSIVNTGTPETGYEFSGFTAGEGVTITSSENVYTLTVPASDVTVDVVYQAIIYNITYKGVEDEGVTFTEDNPEAYTVADESFALNNPSREGYLFTGWTYEGQDEPTKTVTIAMGSTGDKTFTANWEEFVETEVETAVINEAAKEVEITKVMVPKGETKAVIPATVNGYTVTNIAKGAFYYKTGEDHVQDIFLPDTKRLINIEEGALIFDDLMEPTLHVPLELLSDYANMPGLKIFFEADKIQAMAVAPNKFWTFSCGIDVKVPEGVKVYTCRMNDDKTAVLIHELTDDELGGVIKANNGVLLSSARGKYPFIVNHATATEVGKSYVNNLLEPVLKAKNYASDEYYVLMDNEFHPIIANGSEVPACKAVLHWASSAKARLEIILGDDVKTAINGIAADEEGGEWYTISGQRIDKPTKKGLYIKNGKKVIIK